MALDTSGSNIVAPGYGMGYGGYGGFGIELILIIALLGGGRGFGGYGGGYGFNSQAGLGNEVQLGFNDIRREQEFNHIRDGQFGLQRDILENKYDLSTNIGGVKAEVAQLGFANAIIAKNAEIEALKCCCETNRNIDSVKFQAEKDTCAIITNQNALAKDGEMRALYAKLAEKDTALSEQRVISTILQTLQPPRPVPAYAAQNPYENYIAPVRCVNPYPYSDCGYRNAACV